MLKTAVVSVTEAARILGKGDGHVKEFLVRNKVDAIVHPGPSGKERWFFNKSQVEALVPKKEKPIPGGAMNGGKLMSEIAAMKKQISELVEFKVKFEQVWGQSL